MLYSLVSLIVLNLIAIDCANSTANLKDYNKNLLFPNDLSIFFKTIASLENKRCSNDLKTVYDGFLNKEEWALKIFDSSVKFPNGLLYGSLYQMGNYDECVSVELPEKKIIGRYCLADVTIEANSTINLTRGKVNSTIIWAACLPSSCNNDDYEITLKTLLSKFIPNREVTVIVPRAKCTNNTISVLSPSEIIYIVAVSNLLLLVFISTTYHLFFIYKNSSRREYKLEEKSSRRKLHLHEILLCFSVIKSIDKIMKVKNSDLNFICGIKFLSMTFILAGHTLIFTFSGPVLNVHYIYESVRKVQNAFFLNTILLVDTFLMMSGFLVCKLLLQEFERGNKSINLLYVYLGRYIRLTPSYLIIIGLYATILARLGDGPLWNSKIGLEQERCVNSWWINILYVNNYFNTNFLCMFQSWYLAVDTQLFIVGSFYVYVLWKIEVIGLFLIVTSTIALIIFSFASTYVNKYDPTLMVYAPEILDISSNYYFVNVYIKTHFRAVSYLLGMLFGYIVHKLQANSKKINVKLLHLVSVFAITIAVLCMFTISVFYSPKHTYDALESAAYASLHRVGWCLSVGCIIISCICNPTGLINKFLSLKIYLPLSRITYSAYLINGLIELTSIGIQRNPFYMSIGTLANKVLAHTLLTYIAAFILCLLFESPIHNLEKLVLRKRC